MASTGICGVVTGRRVIRNESGGGGPNQHTPRHLGLRQTDSVQVVAAPGPTASRSLGLRQMDPIPVVAAPGPTATRSLGLRQMDSVPVVAAPGPTTPPTPALRQRAARPPQQARATRPRTPPQRVSTCRARTSSQAACFTAGRMVKAGSHPPRRERAHCVVGRQPTSSTGFAGRDGSTFPATNQIHCRSSG